MAGVSLPSRNIPVVIFAKEEAIISKVGSFFYQVSVDNHRHHDAVNNCICECKGEKQEP